MMAKQLSVAEILELAEALMFNAKRLSATEMDELWETGQIRALFEVMVWNEIEILARLARDRVAAGEGVPNEIHERLYKWLLDLLCPPLAREVRNALMKALGRSPRQTRGEAEAVAVTLQYLIDEEKARMKKSGERPRGGLRDAAVAEVAGTQGITVPALKKRIQRHRPRPKR
jgi:hypothetical protein